MTSPLKPFRFSRASMHEIAASATLSLNDRVLEMWDAGRDIYHLGFGESRWPVHPLVAEALRASAQRHSYLPALGMPSLRRAIAAFYERTFQMAVSPSQVVVGPGSKALLYALLLALGEEVILPQPSWVSYAPQAHLLGKPVLWVPSCPEQGFQVELDSLGQQMEESRQRRGNPDLLVLNSPNNPTGTMLLPDKVRALADFAREQELMVLSDEIYALVAHGSIPHYSVARHYPEGTIILGGLSKHLSLGGWRFGFAILPAGRAGDALARALESIAGNIWSCVPAPIQDAALVAFSDHREVESYVALGTQMHAVRTRRLYDRIVAAGIPCVEPAGAFYLFPSFDRFRDALAARGVQTSNDLALYLLDRYELATLPGTAFGCPPESLWLRLSSSYLDARTDDQATRLVAAFRADPDPNRFIEQYHPRLQEACRRLAEFAAQLERG